VPSTNDKDASPVSGPGTGFAAALGLSLALVAVQLLPDAARGTLRYERAAVMDGEAWRLLTANLVHLGWGHLALNVAGLLALAWIFAAQRPPWRWGVALGLACLSTSVGVHLFSPQVHWLVGLSGALHGLFLVGALDWIRAGDRWGWLLLAGLIAKLVAENLTGGLPMTGAMVGGPVITAAHLWGSFGGLAAAGLEAARWRPASARL
jgi:rhomboid family GlyGly-CTERM serine protease